MNMKVTAVFVASLAAATLVPLRADAQDDKKADLNTLIKTFMDESAPLPDREAAVDNVTQGMARVDPKVGAVVKKAIAELCQQLAAKKTDPTRQNLILKNFKAFDTFIPFPDLGPIIRPYILKDSPDKIKAQALVEIERHGVGGLTKELIAIIEEPVIGAASANHLRQQVELQVIQCTTTTPGSDAVVILRGALTKTVFRDVRLIATRYLGALCEQRPPGDFDEKAVRQILLDNSKATVHDEEMACAAALALTHYGSYEGIAEVMKRAEASRSFGSAAVYKTLCQAAHQEKGFLEVAPIRWAAVDTATRENVKIAIKEWWAGAKDTKPDQALFDAMKAAGIAIPKDIESKEGITALISALDLDDRELRYAALDHLVRKTGRADLAKTFKILQSGKGDNQIIMKMPEPPDGFPDKVRQDRLRDQQREKMKAWQAWWEKFSPTATLKNGVWTGA
jgi:hypothetical protein